MKNISIALTVFLMLVVVASIVSIMQVYYQYTSPLISAEIITVLTKPHKIYAAIYFVFFTLSLYLTIKKKYFINVIAAGCLVLIHLIIVNFIGIEWLK